jgi:hypothetical protein
MPRRSPGFDCTTSSHPCPQSEQIRVSIKKASVIRIPL